MRCFSHQRHAKFFNLGNRFVNTSMPLLFNECVQLHRFPHIFYRLVMTIACSSQSTAYFFSRANHSFLTPMSHKDVSHSLRLNLYLLSVVAMWPVRHGRAYRVLRYVSYILAVSAFVFWLGELGTVIRVRYDAKQLLGYVGLLCGHFVSLYKWCVLVVNRRQLQRLVDSLNKCMQTEAAADRSEELHRFTKAANTRATIMTVCWMVGAMYVTLYWSITPLLHNGSLVELPSLHANETFR